MTRDNGVWSFRWRGVSISAPTLDELVNAVASLGITPRAKTKVDEYEREMELLCPGTEPWIIAKTKRDVWKEVAGE